MARLAEYLARFAELLGNPESVHFKEIRSGSAQICAVAEKTALPKIWQRLDSLDTDSVAKPVAKARQAIDDLLFEDHAIGAVSVGRKKVIEFPGRRRPQPELIGPVRRDTSLDGQIFLLGGRDATINVHLRHQEKVYRCEVSVDLARRLAPYFLNGIVRISGYGDWVRVDGAWEMRTFTGLDFTVLESKSLQETLEEMRRLFADVEPETLLTEMEALRRG